MQKERNDMARPAKFNRAAAVERAMNEIWREGYGGSSVKSLSEKLGITRSSFYNAFGNRQSLFNEVLDLYVSQSPDRILSQATPQTPTKLLFTTVFRSVCKARASDPEARGCLAINCVAELCGTNDEVGPMLQDAVMGSVARIETILEWGIARGEIKQQVDARALALSVQSLFIGLNILCKMVHDEDELWSIASTTLQGLDLLVETEGP